MRASHRERGSGDAERDRFRRAATHASVFPDGATGAHRAEVVASYPCGSLQLALFIGEGFCVAEEVLRAAERPEHVL